MQVIRGDRRGSREISDFKNAVIKGFHHFDWYKWRVYLYNLKI